VSRTHRGCQTVLATLLVAFAVAACNSGTEPKPLRREPGGLFLSASVAGTPIATVVVEVTGEGISPSLVFNLELVNRVASGKITVPAGSGRTVTVRGYDTGGIETHRGSTTIDVREGASNPPVTIFVRSLIGDQDVIARLSAHTVTVTPSIATLAPAGTITLTATVRDADGNTVGASAELRWATTAPAVATVSTDGVVTGVVPGSANIVATYRGEGASATVTVIRQGAISLAVGEARTLTGLDAATIEVSGGPTGGEFVLIPLNASVTPAATVALGVSAAGVTGIVGPPTPYASPATPAMLSVERRATFVQTRPRAARFDMELRRAERGMFARRMTAARAARSLQPSASRAGLASLASVPVNGDQVTYNVAEAECDNPSMRTGRVVAVTERAVIVADNANPPGGFTDAEYAQIGAQFDNFVHPLITQNFGAPTDIDANGGRSIIFYTRAVNEQTPPGSQSVTAGFFHARDLIPKFGPDPNGTDDDCPASNDGEMFYMLVPDPNGQVNGNVHTKESVRRATVGVVGHEYQHLINASRRGYINNASSLEEVWLNEGLSHIAEELLFYGASGLAPRQNITLTQLLSSQTMLDAVDAYQFQNFVRLLEYLEDPEGRSPYSADGELATRGAAWALLRYAADHSSTSQQTLWFNLVNSRNAGIANFTAVFGGSFADLLRDWATAQYTDDAVAQAPAVYQHLSWHYRSIMPAIANSANQPPYPLKTRSLTAATPVSLSLDGGSAAYLRFGVAGGATGRITSTSSGSALPTTLSLTVVRTK
jgi:hypothetical protein